MPRTTPKRNQPAPPPGAIVVGSGGTKSRPLKTHVVVPVGTPVPKKKVTLPPHNKSGRSTKPPYLKMIISAIRNNRAHHLHGTTYPAIFKYIWTNFPVTPNNFRRYLRAALDKAVESGKIEKIGPVTYKITKSYWSQISNKKKRSSKKTSSSTTSTPKKRATKKSSDDSKKTTKRKKPTTSKGEATKKRKTATSEKKAKPKSTEIKKKSKTTEGGGNVELKWVWLYEHNGWHQYDKEASEIVEAVYQDFLKSDRTVDVRSVHSGSWAYQVDFTNMTQTNIQHEAHTVRNIKRIQIPVQEFGSKKTYYDI